MLVLTISVHFFTFLCRDGSCLLCHFYILPTLTRGDFLIESFWASGREGAMVFTLPKKYIQSPSQMRALHRPRSTCRACQSGLQELDGCAYSLLEKSNHEGLQRASLMAEQWKQIEEGAAFPPVRQVKTHVTMSHIPQCRVSQTQVLLEKPCLKRAKGWGNPAESLHGVYCWSWSRDRSEWSSGPHKCVRKQLRVWSPL